MNKSGSKIFEPICRLSIHWLTILPHFSCVPVFTANILLKICGIFSIVFRQRLIQDTFTIKRDELYYRDFDWFIMQTYIRLNFIKLELILNLSRTFDFSQRSSNLSARVDRKMNLWCIFVKTIIRYFIKNSDWVVTAL